MKISFDVRKLINLDNGDGDFVLYGIRKDSAKILHQYRGKRARVTIEVGE